MNTIGLDFGTTNSILSFYNEQIENVESWKMGGVDGNSYIPSFLSIDNDEICIGNESKETVFYGESIESYSKFKMLLSEKDQVKLQNNGYITKQPKEITTMYIKKLLDTYKQEQKITRIEKIVVSIPEIWIKDNLIARSELESILKDLQLPNIELKSEPVSAGAYFLHRYKENHNKEFNGHFLIFDFGGGTLDISLLESHDNHMKILERTGRGQSDDFIGKAGVAYDQYVVKKALLKQYNLVLKNDDKILLSLFLEFEKRKISKTDKIASAIEKYRKIKKDTVIFTVEKKQFELEITPSLLIEVFDELFKEDIEQSLSEIKANFNFYKIDDNDDKKFKIVLVGGFSSFYLSQRAVMDFFGSATLSDKRFEQDFTKDDLALSISKGAALLAKDIIIEEQVYPMSMGVMLYTPSGEELIEVILKKGDSVISNKITYLPYNITTGKPTIYFDNGVKKGIIKLDEKIECLYPNTKKINNNWNFGFSVDRNNFYYLHIKDKDGEEKKTEFSHLINEFKDRTYIQVKASKTTFLSLNGLNKIPSDEIMQNYIVKLEQKLDEAKTKNDIEDSINTFSTILEPILKEIISRIAKKYNLIMDSNQTLYEKQIELEKKITDSKKEFGDLHKIRLFRNDKAHPEKFQNLNNLKPVQKELLLSEMQTIIFIIKHTREYFNI